MGNANCYLCKKRNQNEKRYEISVVEPELYESSNKSESKRFKYNMKSKDVSNKNGIVFSTNTVNKTSNQSRNLNSKLDSNTTVLKKIGSFKMFKDSIVSQGQKIITFEQEFNNIIQKKKNQLKSTNIHSNRSPLSDKKTYRFVSSDSDSSKTD